MRDDPADVCLLIEGAYPYVAGGVSSWVQQLMLAQSHLTFDIISLVPDSAPRESRYPRPDNLRDIHHVTLQEMPTGRPWRNRDRALVAALERPLKSLQQNATGAEIVEVFDILKRGGDSPGRSVLLDSEVVWNLIARMYLDYSGRLSFLNYYWTWRALFGGLMASLTADLPDARVYHALSTGYAGLLAARLKHERGRPVILTEHGIYTNERRIEIMMADWLRDPSETRVKIDAESRNLRELWINIFEAYSRACYAACDVIVTLYEGNQELQFRDGADPDRARIIPNGIDLARFRDVPKRKPGPPTVALIGRVVPIKDVRTFIRACGVLRRAVPDVRILIMGPTEEDPEYFEECRTLVASEGLGDCLSFLGQVRVDEHLSEIDLVVLTSISEAQPLVILEGGAAGIPAVATDVGACREMLLGRSDEVPPLGEGGAIAPLANPAAIAEAMRGFLQDPQRRKRAGETLRTRIGKYYDKARIDTEYRRLYEQLAAADAPATRNEGAA